MTSLKKIVKITIINDRGFGESISGGATGDEQFSVDD